MAKTQEWFFSWNAYDLSTDEYLIEYSGSEVFVSDGTKSSVEVYEGQIEKYTNLRGNIRIHCLAFNPV
ncbi:hypothetical protein [Yersinia enterocolitica]|uniref:Uncharacterized protein n=1 Tax=Yersinia enterocolitica TaxID=630 RepID=A0A9P1V4U9_YEREN|nr:hypothetical protein [Yersinia enterocolitica]EKN4802372.1 hypothetical protein [Yersinia enterocolitica]EKN4849716.1 hypothetical protein [Yersinia enterocolitica]EKN5121066.1 hypothetical protein [Yersinia enterocolitica]EKN5999133.1 hypothetical protein [Yersinia enterocolitica]MBW5823245.1 hypothetical protein [Yersinia enterocolitica]